MPKKLEILQRLQAGEITAEEALLLMNQEQNPDSSNKQMHENARQSGNKQEYQNSSQNINHENRSYENQHNRQDFDYDHRHEPGWAESLMNWVGDVVDSVSDGIRDMDIDVNISDFFGGTFSHNKNTLHFASSPILQGLSLLELHGKNDRIEIHGYDGDNVQIQCSYDARYPDADVLFSDENGKVSLLFNDKEFRSVQVLCQVPWAHINQLIAVTKNDKIYVSGINAGDISLTTKNDPIHIEKINCDNITVSTKNGGIKARAITGTVVHFETTNSKITTEDIQAQTLNIITTNSGIRTTAIDAVNIMIKTTNTGLKLEDTFLGCNNLFWDGERSIEAYTTNGGVRFIVPDGVGLNMEAGTSGGKVTCEVPLYGSINEKSYIKGESINYATAGRRLNLRLKTTNASIKVRGM